MPAPGRPSSCIAPDWSHTTVHGRSQRAAARGRGQRLPASHLRRRDEDGATGGLFLREGANGVSLVQAGPGNFVYGQNYRQDVQEGVIMEMAFRGRTLVNVRFHPYVQILNARPDLTDPAGAGHYVLDRMWQNSELDYLP